MSGLLIGYARVSTDGQEFSVARSTVYRAVERAQRGRAPDPAAAA